jgi:hypothetical protein
MSRGIEKGKSMASQNDTCSNILKLAALLGGLSFFILGCGQNPAGMESRLHHDIEDPTNNDADFKYHTMSESDVRDYMYPVYATMTRGKPVKLLPKDDSLYQRLDRWVRAIDSELRNRFPEKLEPVPTPTTQVVMSPVPNAFVAPVQVCYDIPVFTDVSGAEQENPTVIESALLLSSGVLLPPRRNSQCLPKKASNGFISQYVKSFNKANNKCQLQAIATADGEKGIALGSSCSIHPHLMAVDKIKKLMVLPTAGLVNIISGIIPMLTEEEMIAVIAHELGHYYKVHVDHGIESTYDFFYTLQKENAPYKPRPEAELNEIGEKALKVTIPNQSYYKFDGQKIRSELYIPSIKIAGLLSTQECTDETNDSCNESCSVVITTVKSSDYMKNLRGFPFNSVSEEGREFYSKLEQQIMSCLTKIKITEDDDDDDQNKAKSIASSALWDALRVDTLLAPLLAGATFAKTVLPTFKNIAKTIDLNVEKLKAPLREAVAANLGIYTDEQEADDLSNEWLSYIGIDPMAMATAQIKFALYKDLMYKEAGIDPNSELGSLSVEKCIELYKNDWRDQAGENVIIPLGGYEDTHHSSCFRAFNVTQEVKAHQLERPSQRHPNLLSEDDWAKVQKNVEALHENIMNASPSTNPQTDEGQQELLNEKASCIFSDFDPDNWNFENLKKVSPAVRSSL